MGRPPSQNIEISPLTVDGDGNALVDRIAVGADEGWDLAELVDLEVLSGNTLGRLGLDDFDIDVVGLCNSADSD
jgi:hypothetical protein